MKTKTLFSRLSASDLTAFEKVVPFALEDGHARQYPLKIRERDPQLEPPRLYLEFAKGPLMLARPLLQNAYRLVHRPVGLKVSQQNHGIGQIAHIYRGLHISDESVLPDHENADHAIAV